MNILLVTEYFHPRIGGGENWVRQLASELAKRGHTVHLVTSRLPGTKVHERIDGIRVHRVFRSGGFRQVAFMARLFSYLRGFIRSNKIDIVHNMANKPTLPATWAARLEGVPCITSVHLSLGAAWFRVTNPISAALNWFGEIAIFSCSPHSLVHVTARRTERRLKRLTRARVVTIHNALPRRKFANVRAGSVRRTRGIEGRFLLYVGSLLPVKNLRETAREVLRSRYQVTYLVAGDGPERAALERIAAHSDEKHKMRLLGRVDEEEKLALMASCDALVLLSKSEQFPLTVLEALAFDRHIIATDVGAIPDIKAKGFKNLHVIDSVQDLDAALKKVPITRKPSFGKDVFRIFSHEGMIDEFEKAYESLKPQ